ncbi:MAG TPA: trehalose-phosphatase [Casimicrobiaceae bacterium]|nr:trehalose-phosphatase [Casimicrobiaceae bacterium]
MARAPTRARRRGRPPALDTRCALFLDIDGTLLDLASTPDSVRVDADIRALLPALAKRLGGAVALITGRALADADRLFGGLALPVAGQHGLERRAADGTIHLHEASMRGLERLRRELARFATRHPGLLLEDKGATLALHYRRAPGLAAHVHRTLRTMLRTTAVSAQWRLQPGKRILEIKPDGRDKGTAMLEYMAEPPFSGRLPVFVGDDLTDEYGFVAATHLGGWAVKVGRGPTRARFRLRDVAAVRAWLGAEAPVPHARLLKPADSTAKAHGCARSTSR